MSTIGERLGKRLAELKTEGHEVTVAEIARICGVKVQSVYQWINGETKDPKPANLLAVARRLAVAPEWLATGRGPKIIRTPGDKDAINFMPSNVPLVGTAQLGDDGYWHEMDYPAGHGDGFVLYPTKDRGAYALRVKGDSMRPRIKPGEFVIVEPHHPITSGDEVLVKTTDGRSMVKTLGAKRNGMVELLSINEDHRPITIDDKDVELMHYVAAIVKSGLYHKE